MNRCRLLIVLLPTLVGMLPAGAATDPVPAAPAASAAAFQPAKPPQRLLSPAEKRDSGTAPGELRPERPVVPQLKIPLGRPAVGEPITTPRALRREQAASAVTIGDTAARCEAQSDAGMRARCRAAQTVERGGSRGG